MAQWNQCFYCGCALHRNNATYDHVEPEALGGDKMVQACIKCNNAKGFETLEWFREFMGVEKFYGEIRGWKPW